MRITRARRVCLLPMMLVGLSSATARAQNGAWATQRLQPSKELRIPPFGGELLEITAERLATIQRTLEDDTAAEASANAQDEAAGAAHAKWQECTSQDFSASAPPPQQSPAQINAMMEEMKKLSNEYVEKIKNASTADERKQLQDELKTKHQAITAPFAQARVTQRANRDAACGPEPSKPEPSRPEQQGRNRVALAPGYAHMIERISLFCYGGEDGPGYIGPDGSISTDDTPYNYHNGDKGMMSYNAAVYSPAEAKLLPPRCKSLVALQESRGFPRVYR